MSSEGFVCDVCQLDYSTRSQFDEHFWSMIHHKQLEIQYGVGKIHICCLCKTQSDTLSSYAKHLISKTHRDASDARKKQKQLEVASKASSSNERRPRGTPNNRFLGRPNPAGQNTKVMRQPAQTVHRVWTSWSPPSRPISNSNVRPKVQPSLSRRRAKQLRHGGGSKAVHAANRPFGRGARYASRNKSVGGLKNQSAASKSAVSQTPAAKSKAHDSESNPSTGDGREAGVTSASVSGSKPAQTAVHCRRDNPSVGKLHSDATPGVSSSTLGQTAKRRKAEPAAEEPTQGNLATSDGTRTSCSKLDQSGGTSQSAARSAFSAKNEWETSCPPRMSTPGQDQKTSQDKHDRPRSTSAVSALKQSKEASDHGHQRPNSVPSTPTLSKLPPEVTRLNLPRAQSAPVGQGSIESPSIIGPYAVEVQPASGLAEGADEEPSVTRVQLPPSLQRELTKLLVKSQGPRPRPNLAAARSRLHAGEHHQAQVVESPDRMVQQLLMKILDLPKSRDRQLQQIEELQRLVQASKKGSERARFGAQQFPVVSMQFLQSLLASGHLKPLLSDGHATRGPVTQQEHSLDLAAHEQVNSQEEGEAQNPGFPAAYHQELSTSSSTPYPDVADSKGAVQALRRSGLSKKGDLTTSSSLGHEDVNSGEAVKSFLTTSMAQTAPPSQSTFPRQRQQSASEVMQEIVRHVVQTQDKPNVAGKTFAADPAIKTEPNDDDSGVTFEWVPEHEAVDSKETISSLVQSTAPAPEQHEGDSKEHLKSFVSASDSPPETPDQATVPDQVSTPTPALTIKPEPDTDANGIAADGPEGELPAPDIPAPTSPVTWQLVGPLACDGGLGSGRSGDFPVDASLLGQDFPPLTSGQSGTGVDMVTMPDHQMVMPFTEPMPACTWAVPVQQNLPARQTPIGQKDPTSDLQEVLLELSLQEEKLHEKLGAMVRRMKKKQLQYKKLQDQKNEISAEMLGIRNRRLRLLQGAKPSCASPITSPLTTATTTGQEPLGDLPAWLPNVSSSPFWGAAVSGGTFLDSNQTRLLSGPLSPDFALGLLPTLPNTLSMGMQAALPGAGMLGEAPAYRQVVGKAPKGKKRKLKNGTGAAVTQKANTHKFSKTPNLSGSKRPKPTTRAKSRAVQPPNDSAQAGLVATGSTLTSNQPREANTTGVACCESHPKVPREIRTPVKKEANRPNTMNSQYRGQVSWAKSGQELRDGTGCESRLGCSSGSGQPSGLHTEEVKIESVSEPGTYDVFEISSDSDDLVSLCESFTKTRSATKRAAPVESPEKPDPSLSSSNQSWPPPGVFPNHDGAVLGMHLCVASQRLFTVAADCTARVFDINDLSCKRVLSDHTKGVTCLKLWSTKYLCTGSSDRSIRVYDTETLDREISFFCESRVTCLAARVQWLYAGLANGTVDVIDMHRLRLEKNLTCKPECKINSLIPVDPVPVKGRVRQCFLVGYEDWTIGVHDSLNGKLIQSLHGHNGPILCMMIFKHLLYSGSADKTILVHDFKTGQQLRKIGGHSSSVTGLSVYGGSLLSVSLDGKIRHLAHTGALRRIIASFPQKIKCMAHHNKTLYIGCHDGTVQAIAMQPKQPLKTKKKKSKSKKVRDV